MSLFCQCIQIICTQVKYALYNKTYFVPSEEQSIVFVLSVVYLRLPRGFAGARATSGDLSSIFTTAAVICSERQHVYHGSLDMCTMSPVTCAPFAASGGTITTAVHQLGKKRGDKPEASFDPLIMTNKGVVIHD
jgi:hypothetical protein